MISPGFFSLYNAHRALLTSQAALNTVNHNIANANTPGYSRQRVQISAFSPYADPSINQLTGGQLGQGSTVQQITRFRDSFLDSQFQNENSLLGFNEIFSDVAKQLEGILAEPSDSGVNAALQNFFNSAQELSLNPENSATRADFVQQANNLLNVIQQKATQLYSLRTNLVGDPNASGSFATSQAGLMVTDINNLLNEIVSFNNQIITVKASGAEPNDLYDKRDQALDELSKLIDIDVQHLSNGQINLSIAGGAVTLIRSAQLVDTLQYTANPGPVPNRFDIPGLLTTATGGVILNDYTGNDIVSGELKGILDMGQVDAANPNQVNVRSILNNLNQVFTNLAAQVNTLQSTGRDATGAVNGLSLYTTGAANPPGDPIQLLSWRVNAAFLDPVTGPPLVAAAINDPAVPPNPGWAGPGDGRNALAIAQLRTQSIAALGNTSFVNYMNSVTSNLGITSQTASQKSQSQTALLQSIDQRRQSISGVNIDEETIDMLRFQRALEASSKVIQVFDEIYRTLINLT